MKAATLLALVALGALTFSSRHVADASEDRLDGIKPKVERLLGARDERGWAPEAKDTFWSMIARHVSPDEADLVAEIADSLKVNSLSAKRREIARIKAEIRDLNAAIQAAEAEAAATAPAEDGFLGRLKDAFVTTRADLERQAAEKRALVEQKTAEIEAEKSDLAARMNALGASLRPDDVDALLVQVTADDLLELFGFYESALQVHRALATVDLSQNGSEGGRLYYGVHVALVEAGIHMNRVFVKKIDEMYLPKLVALANEAKILSEEGRRSAASAADPDKRTRYEANLRALELTKDVAKVYARLLQDQKRTAEEQMAQFRSELQVAVHTYRTVRVSSQLRDMIRTADESAALLKRLKLPQLRIFVDREMQEEFERLTEKMRPTS